MDPLWTCYGPIVDLCFFVCDIVYSFNQFKWTNIDPLEPPAIYVDGRVHFCTSHVLAKMVKHWITVGDNRSLDFETAFTESETRYYIKNASTYKLDIPIRYHPICTACHSAGSFPIFTMIRKDSNGAVKRSLLVIHADEQHEDAHKPFHKYVESLIFLSPFRPLSDCYMTELLISESIRITISYKLHSTKSTVYVLSLNTEEDGRR